MDTTTIILIIVAALVGALIAYFAVGKKKPTIEYKPDPQTLSEKEALEKTVANLKNQSEEAMASLKSQSEEAAANKKKLEEQLNQNQTLLNEAQAKCKELTEKLSLASSNGKIDPETLKKLEDYKSLQKKLDEAQDELDDLEDEYEEKLKKEKKKYSELSSEKEGLEKQVADKNSEIEKLSTKLKEESDRLNLKIESLSFVTSILTAPEYQSEEYSKVYEKVDALCDFVRNDLQDTIKGIWNLGKEQTALFNEDLYKWAVSQKKRWTAGKVSIAFVGEFSAGKTSIVNRILSQDDPNVPQLPVSTKATTAIPTYISGGIKTDYQFFTPDNSLKRISEDDFRKVTKEVLEEVKGVSNLIKYFVMTYKNSNLNKLSILDTPGFTSNDKEDETRTLEVINECDALFWVFDVNAGTVNKTSINLIKKYLKKPLYVVINKVDTKPAAAVDSVEKLIRTTFNNENIPVKEFIRFSSKAPLQNIMTPIHSISSTSNADEYLINLNEFVQGAANSLHEVSQKGKKEFSKLQKEGNQLAEKYINAIGSMKNDCKEVYDIPQFNNHDWNPFKDGNYEMSVDDYNHMIDLLKRIREKHVEDLRKLYDDQMSKQKKLQASWRIYQEALNKHKQMQDLLEELNKLVNKINK